jgi:tartrate-resistant acid phosphatase type 5
MKKIFLLFTLFNIPSALAYKYCFFGDSGMGNSGQLKVASLLESRGCDEIYHVGDIIYDTGIKNENDPKLQSRFFKYYQRLLDKGVKFHLAIGNHDAQGNTKAWEIVATKHKNLFFPAHNYLVQDERGLCFVVFDSTKIGSLLEGFLAKLDLSKCHYKIAVAHHPYLSSGRHGDSGGSRKRFYEKWIIGKYDAYITGHDHNLSYEGAVKGTHLPVSGAGAALRSMPRKRVFGASKLGILELQVDKDIFRYQFVDTDQKILFSF